ncbi:MAG: hypothetical protein WDA71_00035 [Actinomycetota bacterium]
MSRFGSWSEEQGLPVFAYQADHEALPEAEWDPITEPKTRRHWLSIGNRRIFAVVANDGTVGLLDEHDGIRWLVAPDPEGSGVSIVEELDGARWGSAFSDRPQGSVPVRTFGPTWFTVSAQSAGLRLERTLLCPEGEAPWVLVRVRLSSVDGRPYAMRHIEEWALRPRFANFLGTTESRREAAQRSVRFDVRSEGAGLRAVEERLEAAAEYEAWPLRQVFGPPLTLRLDAVGNTKAEPTSDGEAHPVLRLVTAVEVPAGGSVDLWFRFGVDDNSAVPDPKALFDSSIRALASRLPKAEADRARFASREIPWHAAILTGGSCADGLLGNHTLNQGSAYMYSIGFNGAARDPFQHALPLVYCEPDLALSVLRNTSSWAKPDGDIPYALDGSKKPFTIMWEPSDQALWSMWLAAEYAAATGNLAAFDAEVPYHPAWVAEPVALREHLSRQFRFFVDGVGLGEGGHVRIRNADWNDMAIVDCGTDRDTMIAEGGSVLNSAMAAWVLPVYAGLCDRLGERSQAGEARALAVQLREKVAGEWNGRWFRRALAPGGHVVGDKDCWLEVQPWAILCGAADERQSRELLATIDELHRAGSPLGARVRWPVAAADAETGLTSQVGNATSGGTWFSINMTLVWAAAKLDPALAWDEWRRMSLAAHTEAYPAIWEGTLSGPDSFNSPESMRPGRTWAAAEIRSAMQAFPVNNLHSHCQPLLSYLRLLGVEPTEEGSLRVGAGTGASFASRTFEVRADGSGRLSALGPVTVENSRGKVEAGPGEATW